jgi:hypothetical protein
MTVRAGWSEPWTRDEEIIAEVAGMISDKIGDWLIHGGGDCCPPAVNFRAEETETVIDLVGGRQLRIAVLLETRMKHRQ